MDLFVRISNNVAVDMYKQLGYTVYRQVLGYYSGDPDEDAYGRIFAIDPLCCCFLTLSIRLTEPFAS